MKIELELTQREADELLRCDLTDRRRTSSESRACVQRELESAGFKLRAAIDLAARG